MLVDVASTEAAARARDAADRVLTLGFWLAAAAAAIESGLHLVNAFVLDGEITQFDADAEGNALAWASSVTIFAAALGAALSGLRGAARAHERFAVATILTLLSLDEMVAIHERLGLELGTTLLGLPRYVGVRFWLLLYGPLLLVLVVLLWRIAWELRPRARRYLLAGAASLVVAVALEAVGLPTKWLVERGVDWPDTLRIAAEEAAELIGWALAATALLASTVAGDEETRAGS